MNRWCHIVCIVLGQLFCIATVPNTAWGQSAPGNDNRKDTIAVLRFITQGNALLNGAHSNSLQALQWAKKADSLATILNFTRGKGESLLLIASALKRLEKGKEAIPYLEQATDIFTKLQNNNGLLRTYHMRAATDPDLDQKAAYYDKTLTLMKAGGERQSIPSLLAEASEVKMMQAQLPAAEEMLKESIRLSKELGIDQVQWQYGLLGAVQIQRRETLEALKNELLAIKIGEQYGDTSARMAEIYNYAAIIYLKMGKLEESGQYLRKAIATGTYAQDPMLTVQFRANLANILIRQNKLKEALENLTILERTYERSMPLNAKIQMLSRFVRCYTVLNDLNNAGRYAEQLIVYSDGMKPDEYDQIAVYTELNRYLIASGQYQRAARYVEQHRLIADKFKLPDQRTQAYFYRFKIDSALGNTTSALRYFQLYTTARDSAANENIANQLNQLHVEFETEKKNKELLLKEGNIKLLVQEAALQKALSDKRTQELALNNQALELKQKDLTAEKQRVQLLTKHAQLQEAEGEKQKQDLIIQQKDIELLKKNNKLQEADLERIRMMRNAIIVGAVLLGLMSLLVYSRYRMKKHASEKLEQQREEIRLKNFSLQALIADKDKLLLEKEWLVKEVHHRVKNNLQMVMSLLNSQSVYLSNEDALLAIRESQRRMQAIALIHQKLYEKEGSAINMQAYIAQLIDYLKDSFNCEHIKFILQVEPLELDVTMAMPVGLILNEAITNSLKYAFPGATPGNIWVSLKVMAASVELTITDDGIGLPASFTENGKDTLGMSLMEGLAAQLKGTWQIISANGVKVVIRFQTQDAGPAILNGNTSNAAIEHKL